MLTKIYCSKFIPSYLFYQLFKFLVTSLFFICLAPNVMANELLHLALKYNAFVLDDFSAESSDVQGRMAVGGNVYLRSYGVASAIEPSETDYSIVAGGSVDYINGQIFTGGVIAGGDVSSISENVSNSLEEGALILGDQLLPIDFEGAFQGLLDVSLKLSELKGTGDVEYKWGGVYLSGNCESEPQVFHINGQEMLNASSLVLSCISDDATLILNISGPSAGFKNIGLAHLSKRASRTLYNFHDASTLELTWVGVEGTILAPKANVVNPRGAVNGTVIAKSWSGPMELHHVPFVGDLDHVIPKDNVSPIFVPIPDLALWAEEYFNYFVSAEDADLDTLSYIVWGTLVQRSRLHMSIL